MHLLLLLVLSAFGIVFESHPSNRNRKTEAILMAIVLSLFAGLRGYSVGIDVGSYVMYFRQDADLSIGQIFSLGSSYAQSTDPIFHCFLHILSLLSRDPQIMLIVIGAFLAFSLTYYAYHQRASIFSTVLLFITLRLFPFTLTGLRQAMAMSFLFLALVSLQENKIARYFVLTLLGALFHSSAIIFLLALPLLRIKKTRFVIITIGLVVIIEILSRSAFSARIASIVFKDKFLHYYDSLADNAVSLSSTTIVVLSILILGFVFKGELSCINDKHLENLRLGAVAVALAVVGQGFPSMFRLSYYFMVVLFPMFHNLIKTKLKAKDYMITYSVAVIMLVTQYLFLGPGAGIDNYVFFWS